MVSPHNINRFNCGRWPGENILSEKLAFLSWPLFDKGVCLKIKTERNQGCFEQSTPLDPHRAMDRPWDRSPVNTYPPFLRFRWPIGTTNIWTRWLKKPREKFPLHLGVDLLDFKFLIHSWLGKVDQKKRSTKLWESHLGVDCYVVT